ncbi:hypothetical protein Aperf_G00000090019 [Anoplocephala perfoliata]
MGGSGSAETDKTLNAKEEKQVVDKCHQNHFPESLHENGFLSRLMAMNLKSNLSTEEIKTDSKRKAASKETSKVKEIVRTSVAEDIKMEFESPKGKPIDVKLNLLENMQWDHKNEKSLRCLAHPASYGTNTSLHYLDRKFDGHALSLKPIQASQSVDGYQYPSAAFLHPDYHDRSKTGVFALRGGESPSPMQVCAVMRAVRCSRLQFLGRTLSPTTWKNGLQCLSGFCRGWDRQLVVADAYNHRILVYSPRFELVGQFGVAGRAQGHLWHPCRVAVTESQRYVVCDRGQGCWRLQIFTPNGHFVRTIPLHNCVNITSVVADGNEIVVIDSVTSKIVVVSEDGRMLRCLYCSLYVREPSAMIAYEDNYYICDYKGHSVVVMDKEGRYKRSIGGEGLTDYPSGIEISRQNDVLVSDSHANCFHVVVFNREGSLLHEFAMKDMRMSQCKGLALTEEGYVVTLNRNMEVILFNTLHLP